MKGKKLMKKRILFVVILIIIIGLISVELINKVLLNKNEKEILEVLKELNYYLQNPKETEENEFDFRPKEAIDLKQYISSIYEVRKMTAENGNLIYLFKVSLTGESNGKQDNILVVINGELFNLTINEETIKKENEESESEWVNNISYQLKIRYVETMNKLITEKWDQAVTLTDVNFTKILNKI